MKTVITKTKIDSIDIGEINLVKIGTTRVPLTAKFAMKALASGTSFGSGTMSSWSEETNQKLRDLLESMENDIAAALFEEGALAATESSDDKPDPEDVVPEL